jgi:hypothetical protein
MMYHNHNVHFESYAAAMAGQYARARRSADTLTANVTSYIADMPMLEAFVPQQYCAAPLREMGRSARAASAGGVAAADDDRVAFCPCDGVCGERRRRAGTRRSAGDGRRNRKGAR